VKIINTPTLQQLTECLRKQLSDTQTEWFDNAIHDVQSDHDSQEPQLLLSAMASRNLTATGIPDLQDAWNTDEAARVILLQTYIDSTQNSHYDAIWQAYRIGDEKEKAAYIKGLSILDPEGELLDIALHTGRTNNVYLFSSIALNNPYPAKHYDNRAFEQLVLKALFLDLNINHIRSLPQRLRENLSNVCMDLVHERLAADRNPPTSIWLAIDIRHLDDASQTLYLKFLSDPVKEHRYYSLLALKQLEILDLYQTQLELRRKTETEPTILQLLA